jgi:hypothetical protein
MQFGFLQILLSLQSSSHMCTKQSLYECFSALWTLIQAMNISFISAITK